MLADQNRQISARCMFPSFRRTGLWAAPTNNELGTYSTLPSAGSRYSGQLCLDDERWVFERTENTRSDGGSREQIFKSELVTSRLGKRPFGFQAQVDVLLGLGQLGKGYTDRSTSGPTSSMRRHLFATRHSCSWIQLANAADGGIRYT
ncbi:unnamed protein product [Diplocarpon coronariae]|nr:hypothetical protein JHW43_007942 [Diplocarpon mali]